MALALLVPLMLAAAGAQPVWEVGSGPDREVNNGGTSSLSQGKLSDTMGIMCYTDYKEGSGFGVCSLLVLSGDSDTIAVGTDFTFNSNLTEYISVAPFSETTAVVCYSDSGNTKLVTCVALKVQVVDGNNSLSMGQPVEINAEAEQSPYISASGLSSSLGLVCYMCNGCANQDRYGLCSVLELEGTALTATSASFELSGTQAATTHISVQGFSASSAVACYSNEGAGTCDLLEVTDSSPWIESKSSQVFYTSSGNFLETITQAKVSDASGVLCFADALNDQNSNNLAACASFQIADSALSFSPTEVFNNGTTAVADVSVAPLTNQGGGDGAIVCYADLGVGINENKSKSAGPATCQALETSGDSVSVGSPSVVYDGLTERVSLSSLSEDTGIMCYTLSSSSLMCRAVSIVPTTTTSTQTETHTSSATVSSTSETLTASETSSTTASTNSLPSTLTSTTPHTTTETFTTTSPHTTTVTSFTQTSVTELSGSTRPSVGGFLVAAGATVVAALFA